jgi:hypothetical protein
LGEFSLPFYDAAAVQLHDAMGRVSFSAVDRALGRLIDEDVRHGWSTANALYDAPLVLQEFRVRTGYGQFRSDRLFHFYALL